MQTSEGPDENEQGAKYRSTGASHLICYQHGVDYSRGGICNSVWGDCRSANRAGLTNITSDPLGYVRLRAQAITRAYLQPFGTTFIGGPSLKDTAVLVLRGKASLAELVRTEGFWPKLTLYIFHYVSVGLGIVGLALSYRRWREILSLALILLYVTAVQSVLHVRARMLFPLMPFFWIAAGYAILRLWTHSDLSRPQKQVAAET